MPCTNNSILQLQILLHILINIFLFIFITQGMRQTDIEFNKYSMNKKHHNIDDDTITIQSTHKYNILYIL